MSLPNLPAEGDTVRIYKDSKNNDMRDTAFALDAFPCNPRPFLKRIIDLIDEGGTGAIRSDRAKANLWIVMAQAYGQLARIDLSDEWDRLYRDAKLIGGDES